MRACGDCQLCCKLVPVVENEPWRGTPINKPAGVRCPHQRHRKGCMIYARRPFACAAYSCRWLAGAAGTEALGRPDRSHYVLDPMPDYVKIRDNNTGKIIKVEVVQVWLDPDYPDADLDPGLRSYLEQMGEHGVIALVRLSNKIAFALIPPSMNSTGKWLRGKTSMRGEQQHSVGEVLQALAEIRERHNEQQ